jgi:hypothetical protein
VPGMAVGAGGAFTGGVKRLPPVGLMLFSVGATLEVVGVVEDGPPGWPPPQAVRTPIERAAAMPTLAATRRVIRRFMLRSNLCCSGNSRSN